MISQKIIKIATDTRYSGLNNIFTHRSSIKNSLCGDKIKIEVITKNTKISSMRYETESCILCEASASLMAKKFKNYPLKELKKNINILKDNIKNKKLIYSSKFKEYEHLINKNNDNRLNCVTLPLDCLLKAFKQLK
jgi:nitrogen fixation NifU-like protein|tara:strand:- start:424 stop:831 length:408 start_codon:yes stop_codon:yes gene_type:complete